MSDVPVAPGGDGDDDVLDALVHRADLDGLVRLVDDLCAGRAWARLLQLRDRCRAAVLTGRQLWPAATLAEYRLALHAPPEWTARVLDESSGRFTVGPLTEVAAQRHELSALRAPLEAVLGPGAPRLGFVAHERALRGEPVPDDLPNPLELPFALQAWEPAYQLASYSDAGVEAPAPPVPHSDEHRHADGRPGSPVDDPDVELAVRQLFEPWTAASNGRVEVRCVEGDAVAAVLAHGVHAPSLAPLSPAEALAWLAWAGASGGAHGRRRGAAIGRFGAWWLLAALADLLDEWPVPPDALGEAATSLRWWWWSVGEPLLGWQVHLAVHDEDEGYAWSLTAVDAA